ncbi:MAG TPA: class GN sortase [Campylobacterales bacterium]|nr:class GN sortase [Campylobacterales bacterium]
MQIKFFKLLPWISLVLALLFFSKSGYLYLKSELAQVFIAKAWQQVLIDANLTQAKPWSWADTYPIAKITSNKHNKSLYILEGTSGEALAFGPGHYEGTALPAADGDSVIAGHRDSHFSFLRDVKIGDTFSVQNYKKAEALYLINEIKIIDSAKNNIEIKENTNRLQLITCYPFDAISSGGSLRYIVYAKRMDEL